MTTVAIIQARMASTRLPGKVLETLGDRSVLGWVVDAARAVPGVDRVVVATSDEAADDPIVGWCRENEVTCHRGPEDDVLARFAQAATAEGATAVMRLTADCPFLDPQVCGEVLAYRRLTGADYVTNAEPATWPDGLDCEVFTAAALARAAAEAERAFDREHVTPYIRHQRRHFRTEVMACPVPGLGAERWTLDTPEDLRFLRAVADGLPADGPPSYLDVLARLDAEPELRELNQGIRRNTGGQNAASAPEVAREPRRYGASGALLERAEKVIPLGSQTFSKSRIQWPEGAAPLFLSHGRGGRVWDVDGNCYVDMVCGLLPVVLGYCDPDVDEAIKKQLADGISFSLATELESELAERLVEIIPCAEMARIGKNGTDATTAAVRIARAATGRDRIAVCGYHGWQDWYIGATTRNKGVPQAVSDMTHRFPYNDLAALQELLESRPGGFAAVILEPMTVEEPAPGYLDSVRQLAHRHGAILVFDEVVTGFRFALGGAQELFGVTPDLACFGKAMGNGMPISVIVGRAELMAEMEEIFFSSTFGGEALSIAAAIAVVDKMCREPVIETLWSTGRRLAEGAGEHIAAAGLAETITLAGMPPWTLLGFHDHPTARKEAIKTLFQREVIAAGALIGAGHNVCYAHDDADVAVVLDAYDTALASVAEELDAGNLEARLDTPVIEPVFKVR
jgi:glutamate-1-semialdehyde 2,1-aminomutase/spore coat polysaccharide biosynthesis protein SpsF